MIIRCARIDRFVFDGYVHSSRTAQEWIREAESRTPWFTIELFADFFLCFYLANPQADYSGEATPFHRWLVGELQKQFFLPDYPSPDDWRSERFLQNGAQIAHVADRKLRTGSQAEKTRGTAAQDDRNE